MKKIGDTQYIKVKEILEMPAGASLDWETLSMIFEEAQNNELISDTDAEVYIDMFNSVLEQVEPILELADLVEQLKPAINIGVQVVGAWSNPALIGQMAQDLAMQIQQKVMTMVIQQVEGVRDYILNIQIDFGEISKEELDEIKDKLADIANELNAIADAFIAEFNNNETNVGNLEDLQNCIENFLKSTQYKAIEKVIDASTKEEIINSIKEEFNKTGTCMSLKKIKFYFKPDETITPSTVDWGTTGIEGTIEVKENPVILTMETGCTNKGDITLNLGTEGPFVISVNPKSKIIEKIVQYSFPDWKTGDTIPQDYLWGPGYNLEIDETDFSRYDKLFAIVDDALKRMKEKFLNDIRSALEGSDIDISNLIDKYSGDLDNLNKLLKIKDGLLNTLKTIIVANTGGFLDSFLDKDNVDIEALMERLKDALNKDIERKKYLCMMKIKKALENVTDVEEAKSITEAILRDCPTDYDMASLLRSLLDEWIKGFLAYKKAMGGKSDASTKRAYELYGVSDALFGAILGDLNDLLRGLLKGILVEPLDLESDQFVTENYSKYVPDVCENLTEYISQLGVFELDNIETDSNTYIKEYPLFTILNSTYGEGVKSICFKFASLRGRLYNEIEKALSDVKKTYKEDIGVTIPSYLTKEEDVNIVTKKLDENVLTYLNTISNNAMNVVIKNTVPCKNCMNCGALKDKMMTEIGNNVYLLKKYTKKKINTALEANEYTGTLSENQALALSILTDELKDDIRAKEAHYLSFNDIYKKYCYEEEEKLKEILVSLIK